MKCLNLRQDLGKLRSKITFLIAIITAGALGYSAEPEPSRLRYSAPEGWETTVHPETQLVSVAPPNAKALVTVAPSMEFAGSAQEWQDRLWNGGLQTMKLDSLVESRAQGQFLTRMGVFSTSDGSHCWMCLYSMVKNGRGEAIVFCAADEKQFFGNLLAVNQMVDAITVSKNPPYPPASAAGKAPFAPPTADLTTKPEPNLASGTAPGKMVDVNPVLDWSEPDDFFRSGGTSPVQYFSTQVDASMEVYPFQVYQGDVGATFQQTMLRNWISPRFREAQLAGPPAFFTKNIPGADFALAVRFHESPVGIPNERLRVLIVAGNRAAVVDVVAHNAFCWQKANPSVNAMLKSLRVQRRSASPSVSDSPGPSGAAVAGLYMGFSTKYNFMYGYRVNALHYYLFSEDGRVHCCFDFPPGPNRDGSNFDFETAQRADPGNTGRYTVRGNQLVIQMSERTSQPISVTINDRKNLKIQGTTYERQK